MPTIDARMAAGVSHQLENGGVSPHPHTLNWEMWDKADGFSVVITAHQARNVLIWNG